MKKLLINLFVCSTICGYLESEGERSLDTRLFESAWLRINKHYTRPHQVDISSKFSRFVGISLQIITGNQLLNNGDSFNYFLSFNNRADVCRLSIYANKHAQKSRFSCQTHECLKVCPKANNNLEWQNCASLNVSSDETAVRAELLSGKLNLRLEICLFKPFWIGLEYVTLQPDIRLNFSLKSSNFNNCQQELSIVITFWTI